MCGIAGIYCFSKEAVILDKKQDNFRKGKDNPVKNAVVLSKMLQMQFY